MSKDPSPDISNAINHAIKEFSLEPYGSLIYFKASSMWSIAVKKGIYLGTVRVFEDSNDNKNTVQVGLSWT